MARLSMMVALGAMVLAVPAIACDKDAKVTAQKVSDQPSGCCKAKSSQMVSKVMERLPHLTYKVGEFQTCCPDAAKTKAGADGKVEFLVGDKVYESKTEAVLALSDVLEQEANKMSKVVFAVGEETFCCPMTAGQKAKQAGTQLSYRVAGVDFDNQDKANQASKLVSALLTPNTQESQTLITSDEGKSKGDCAKSCAKAKAAGATASAGTTPCCKSKGTVQTAEGAAAPSAAAPSAEATKTADAQSPASGSCDKAEQRLASIQDKIRQMVEAAVTVM